MKRFAILLALIVGVGCIALPVSAQVRKAEKALKNQQYQEALSFADQALAKKPEDAKAFEVKGRIYQGMASMAEGADYHDRLHQPSFDEGLLSGTERVVCLIFILQVGESVMPIEILSPRCSVRPTTNIVGTTP